MSRSHATREGFSAVVRQPVLYLAELAWRWTFGVVAIALTSYSILAFLHSIPVSDRDAFGLSGFIPGMFQRSLEHIFHGTGPRLVKLSVIVLAGMALLWWLSSSAGRAATLRALMPEREYLDDENREHPNKKYRDALTATFRLHFLRVLAGAVTLMALMASFASAVLSARDGSNFNVGTFYLVYLPLLIVIYTLWSALNWHLELAPILAFRNGTMAWDSVLGAKDMARRRARQFIWVRFVMGMMRFFLTGAAFFALLFVLGISANAPKGFAIALMILLAMAYFAVSDFLHVARTAAHVRIAVWDEEESRQAATAVESEPPPAPPTLDLPPLPPQLEAPPEPAG